jgi:hypothetical protein
MENIIGKKYVKIDYESRYPSFNEVTICDSELIAGKEIVYTTDGRSFCSDDLQLSDLDDLKKIIMEMTQDISLKGAFNKKFNKDFDLNHFFHLKSIQPKTKTFKIFGWTIAFSKSK